MWLLPKLMLPPPRSASGKSLFVASQKRFLETCYLICCSCLALNKLGIDVRRSNAAHPPACNKGRYQQVGGLCKRLPWLLQCKPVVSWPWKSRRKACIVFGCVVQAWGSEQACGKASNERKPTINWPHQNASWSWTKFMNAKTFWEENGKISRLEKRPLVYWWVWCKVCLALHSLQKGQWEGLTRRHQKRKPFSLQKRSLSKAQHLSLF